MRRLICLISGMLAVLMLASCGVNAGPGTAEPTPEATQAPEVTAQPSAQPSEEPEATAEPTEAPTDAPVMDMDAEIASYRQELEKLAQQPNLDGVKTAYAGLMERAKRYTLPDEMIFMYLDLARDSFTGIYPEDPTYKDYGLDWYQAEGDGYLRVDGEALAQSLAGMISAPMDAWLRLDGQTDKARLFEDAGVTVTWDELGDWAVRWEAFHAANPGFMLSEWVDADARQYGYDYKLLMAFFVGQDQRFDNTPMVEKGVLMQEYRDAMKRFIEKHAQSPLADFVKNAYGVWEAAEFKDSQAVHDQLEMLVNDLP